MASGMPHCCRVQRLKPFPAVQHNHVGILYNYPIQGSDRYFGPTNQVEVILKHNNLTRTNSHTTN
jgi:hypothetical protein